MAIFALIFSDRKTLVVFVFHGLSGFLFVTGSLYASFSLVLFLWFVSVNENTKGLSLKPLLWKMRLIRFVVRRIRILQISEPSSRVAKM